MKKLKITLGSILISLALAGCTPRESRYNECLLDNPSLEGTIDNGNWRKEGEREIRLAIASGEIPTFRDTIRFLPLNNEPVEKRINHERRKYGLEEINYEEEVMKRGDQIEIRDYQAYLE